MTVSDFIGEDGETGSRITAPHPSIPALRTLDLFSGIGGFSLGLERTGGFETVAFCEIEEFPRRVLAKHWPHVPIHGDVRTLTRGHLRWIYRVETIDVICGGFPCQDISDAGERRGLTGKRSGLWAEFARLIGELRPRYVIVENVAALLGRGMGAVLGDLARLGYDAEWRRISAADVGAPHLRQRIWIVAYPGGEQRRLQPIIGAERSHPAQPQHDGAARSLADTANEGAGRRQQQQGGSKGPRHVADAEGERRGEARQHRQRRKERSAGGGDALGDAHGARLSIAWPQPTGTDGLDSGGVPAAADWWATEPDVGRVAHGVPSRVDRLRGLGNAVVPQIIEAIGNAILNAARRTEAPMHSGEANPNHGGRG